MLVYILDFAQGLYATKGGVWVDGEGKKWG